MLFSLRRNKKKEKNLCLQEQSSQTDINAIILIKEKKRSTLIKVVNASRNVTYVLWLLLKKQNKGK